VREKILIIKDDTKISDLVELYLEKDGFRGECHRIASGE
jgi:DNA-binding response OmpR family regulator